MWGSEASLRLLEAHFTVWVLVPFLVVVFGAQREVMILKPVSLFHSSF